MNRERHRKKTIEHCQLMRVQKPDSQPLNTLPPPVTLIGRDTVIKQMNTVNEQESSNHTLPL